MSTCPESFPEHCQSQQPCTPALCRRTCGLEVVDALLRESGDVRGEEVDSLLDLRSLLRRRENAEAALAVFCQLRRTMEERHYLGFYRLRRWLENQVEVAFAAFRGAPERRLPLRLSGYCLEAVRSTCLLAALQSGEKILAPRVRFHFVAVPEAIPALSASASA
jgi:hypothetical protein